MRHTKHDSLSGRKSVRANELNVPTKAEIRMIGRWLDGQAASTEPPKRFNIEERKRRNRARAKAVARVRRWRRRHRKAYNAYMSAYRKRRRLAAKADKHSFAGQLA
jgi:hypothetical protein